MIMDQPVIDYNYKKNNGRKSMIATKKEVDELEALTKAWEEKRNGRSYAGKTISLDDFMADRI